MLVKVIETVMGDNCDVDKEKNIAIDLVTLSKNTYEIDFERELRVEQCEDTSTTEESDEETPITSDSGAL